MINRSDTSYTACAYDFSNSISTQHYNCTTQTLFEKDIPNNMVSIKKKNATRTELINKILQEIPIFAALHDIGAFNTACGMLISEKHWDKVRKMMNRPEMSQLLIYMVNITEEGLFFKNLGPGLGAVLIYGLFDEDIPALNKANFVKKANTLLIRGGSLILLSDKEHPDNLRDIVAISGVEGGITEISIDHIETRGLFFRKS